MVDVVATGVLREDIARAAESPNCMDPVNREYPVAEPEDRNEG